MIKASDPLARVTPLLITYNEEANIIRTLAGLAWAKRILVVDSGSNDSTLSILSRTPHVDVVFRRFDTFADQCNHGLGLIQTEWCLSLDADHVISPRFVRELATLLPSLTDDVDGVFTPFRYLVAGRPLRGTLLPPRINLVRVAGGHYVNDGHAHRFVPRGATRRMQVPIDHDDRKPLSRWLAAQQGYLQKECDKLLQNPPADLSLADRLRTTHLVAPFAALLVCLVFKGGVFDGWRGWFYAFQRMYVELLLSLMLWDRRHWRPKP